jgi:hypothetical protein
VAAGRDQLGGVQREALTLDRDAVRVMACDELERLSVAGAHGALQATRLVAELLEARILRQGDGRHGNLLRMPAVRVVRPKEGEEGLAGAFAAQVGCALPADRGLPAEPCPTR